MRRYRNPRSLNNTINQLSTNLIGSWRRQTLRSRRIIVIVNPAAGQDRPILKAINSAMQSAGVDWNLVVTRQAGDGFRLARHAVAAGADTVAVYGGDGTITEVASGLGGSKVVMGILPGGTSNWIANSFGVPRDINQALSLIIEPGHSVPLPTSRHGEPNFLYSDDWHRPGSQIDRWCRKGKESAFWGFGLWLFRYAGNCQP